jgi:cysteine-rich repeat protein
MKLNQVSATTALLAAAVGLVGCSSDQKQATGDEKGASIGFHLLASNGVTLSSAQYDLNTQAGANVVDGSVPVPNDDSTVSLGIQNLGAGDYTLAFSATGQYQGHAVPCTSAPTNFHLNTNQQLDLPTITLTCTVTNQADTSSGVNADVTVAVETITIGSVIETFTYGPRTVKGHNNTSGVCTFPPVALKIATVAANGVSYTWSSATDGTFGGTPADGTYQCVSGGLKTLTLTGVKAGVTSTKSVTVNCDDSICASGAICQDGIKQTGEQCDEAVGANTAHCVNCQIVVTCGDGIVDTGEQCDDLNLPTATCDASCHTLQPISCGDGTINGTEQCDNGAANSNTTPNACRTNCTLPSCGDGVSDTAEQCDSGAANSDTLPNACRTTCQSPKCGDGVVDTGEQCDAAALPTATCTVTCTTAGPPPNVCDTCMHTNPAVAPYQTGYCDNDPLCVNVESCILGTTGLGCFSPVPASCFCGSTPENIDQCDLPTFVPQGPCASSMTAAAGTDSPTNEQILNRFFTFGEYPLSNAMSIIDLASRACATECASNL